MIRLITTHRLRRILGDYDRKATLNNDLLTELEDVTEERDRLRQAWTSARLRARRITLLAGENARLRADIKERIALAQKSMALRDQSVDRAAAAYNTRIRTLTGERDRARNIAALLEAEAARMQAAAEAADIPIVDGLDPDDYLAAVKAVLADIAARKKAAADCLALRIADPKAACLAAEAEADWAARPEAL